MKPASSTLATFLNGTTSAPFVAHVYTFTSSTGTATYLTDHSANITVNGHTFLANGVSFRPLLKFLGRRQVAGLDPGEVRISMYGGAEATWGGKRLQKAALDREFDGYTLRVERIFGSALDTPDTTMGTLPLHEGPVSKVKIGSLGIELVVSDLREGLTRPFPRRILQPGCNWQFGSTECGISLASHTFTDTVSTGSASQLTCALAAAKVDGYFSLGLISFRGNVTSALSGVKRGIQLHDAANSLIVFDRPLPVAPAAGDLVTITAGCLKTLTDCGFNGTVGKFGVINGSNFGGFPFAPNPDTVGQ